MRLIYQTPTTFLNWLARTKQKRKFYIWTTKQKEDVKEVCLALNELWLLFMVELQEIKYEKAVEILERKYRL